MNLKSSLWLVCLLCVLAVSASANESRIGLDYVFPFQERFQSKFWPRQFAAAGLKWVNFHLVSWADIEPQAPVGGVHVYKWKALDGCVRLWQAQGFDIVLTLRMKSGWFSGPIVYAPDVMGVVGRLHYRYSDRLPAPQFRKDLQAWMAAMVERYDGDGKDDMPGLRAPVLHYQVGNEFANPMFWTGSVEDYGTYLKLMAPAAKGACPEVKIVSNGIRWNDAFEGDEGAAKFEERFKASLARLPNDKWRRGWRRMRKMTEYTVAQAGVFDILDGGGNGPYYRGSAGYMKWIRQELAKGGFASKTAVWDLEARCEPQIVLPAHTNLLPETAIVGGKKVLLALRWSWHPKHEEAGRWYRREQAKLVAKVFVTRFAAGFEKVFMGMPNDWDGTAAAWLFPNPYIGFLSSKGHRWPAYHTLALVVAKLDGFVSARKVAAPAGVALYRFDFGEGRAPVWCAWVEIERRLGLDEVCAARSVVFGALKGRFWQTVVPLKAEKASSSAVGKGGRPLSLLVDDTPVFLERVVK